MTRIAAFVALALSFAAPAWAASSVELRPDAAVHDGRVTLADLFAGAGAEGSVVVADGAAPGASLVLDAGQLQAVAGAHGLIWANSQRLRRVIARANAVSEPGASSRGRPAEVLVYTRDFQAGEIVRPEDLAWSKSPAFDIPLDTPGDSRSVIGQAVKRPMRAGAAVSRRDVAAPLVIKKDDTVAVAYEADGIKLVLQGKAVNGASAGDLVQVINPGSKKIIQAIATGPGEAIVGPEADRLKAALRADPQLLASTR